MVTLRKVVASAILLGLVALACPSGEHGRSNSLFLASDLKQSVAPTTDPISQLVVDASSDKSTIQYSVETQANTDPAEYGFNPKNCVIVLSFAGMIGLAYLLKNRLFPHYL